MSGYRKIEFSPVDRPERVTPGSAPILQWIDIANLVIDDSYQRELRRANWTSIRRIAANFRWAMFSPVFVSPVEGGVFAIIDGQHRTHAAAMCGFSQVPCQVVQMTREEQASSFATVNGAVTKVTPYHLLKAGLAAGEDWATGADAIAAEAGCRLMTYFGSKDAKKPGQIYGVSSFLKIVDKRPRAAVIAALKHLREAEGYGDNADFWDMSKLMPVVMALAERPRAMALPEFRAALEEFDFWELSDRDDAERTAARRRGIAHPPKSETMRAGILEWIDKTFPARLALPAAAE
ncbi:ParB N-terminal domain-containing protein [Rhizobium leguminosarum]|uniref:ParB N-terminal domain-containing protein n=1 Tax=Rhizobium leguminosarum TaxID=384 RepID=UPI001C8FC7DB|nr:DUF6551 family protein [Rhizobium leguminosarum]MBY2918885.1 ParB N-terminal domain-containing protein [Rhizobium leguminosarum]MBY2974520.1 ParB N-terminal domain-containing protein [Rhizobium leguminosarum]MBY2982015.1 ParB N-terminal domain-containing protein [Rhizobium leguminosarum]MBY3010469.1 ParB N-terminal domain-containing protein [Rhizobium leguminosarum]